MVAPAHVAALAMACFGLGLIAAAFLGEAFGAVRLLGGLGLLALALIVSGLQVLSRNGAAAREEA
jgi:hypothetical protein